MSRTPILLLRSSAAITGAALVALALLGPHTPDFPIMTVSRLETQSSPAELTLACPPGTIDSFAPDGTATTSHQWSSVDDAWTTTQANATITSRAANGILELPSGVVVAGQSGGEMRGLSLSPCSPASSDQWLSVGATTVGEDAIIVLANPASTPSVVSITGIGPQGYVNQPPQQVNVPAHSQVRILPGTWFPDLSRLALHLQADGPGVAAWMQTSAMDGERPLGATWTVATPAATRVVIPGIAQGLTEARVRLANTGGQATTATLTLLGSDGSVELSAGTLDLPAQTVIDVPLGAITQGGATLVVEADQALAAHVIVDEAGQPWGQSDEAWGERSVLASAQLTRAFELPSASQLHSHVEEVLTQAPVRASQVDARDGVNAVSAELILTSLTQAVTVTLPGTSQKTTIAPGTQVTMDAPETAGTLSADGDIYAAIRVTVETPTGLLRAVWPLGGRIPLAQVGSVNVNN